MSTASVFILPTTGTFIVEVVIFLTLLFLLAKYVLPPLNAAMEKRQEDIRHTMEAADRARAEAAAIDDERRQALEEARHQAREIVEQANRTAEQLAADATAKRQADNDQARRSAEHEIELARQRAVEEAAERMGDLVVQVVERILRREVDASAHRDLIDEAVAALGAPVASAGQAQGGRDAVNPALEGYANAALAGTDVGVVADQLAEVDDAVRNNSMLFAAMTDTALNAAVRRAVLGDVLESRVSERVRRVAQYTVSVVPAPDVPAAFAWLAHRSREVADGLTPAPANLGHLGARRRVGGFAAQVFEDLTTEQLEEVEDQLFRFTRTVADTPALRAALSDRDLPADERTAIARDLLAGKVEPATLRLVEYVVVGGRPRDTVGTLDWLVEETAKARGWRVARVRAAQAVDTDERERLARSLTELVGHPVELQVSVDGELLAGVVVEVGDLRIDSTARAQLNRLRDRIESGRLEHAGNGSDSAPR